MKRVLALLPLLFLATFARADIDLPPSQVAGGAAGVLVEVSWNIDVSGVVPGDFLALNLYRLGSTDANSDTARMYTIECAGWFWQ